MKPETAVKAHELLEEIKSLKKYKELLGNDRRSAVHFKIAQHYGEVKEYEVININRIYNDRFFKIVDDIIRELEIELDNL